MSWAEEDWTVGLSQRVLHKVKELQTHKERLSRENKQKQLQLDNINTNLEKQTVKYEEVRGELHSVQRELQSVQEEAQTAITSKEHLTQELHTRQALVCALEGQLDSARSLNSKLTQEVKRLEAELEKLQNSSRLVDTTLFSTPCWSTTSPWEHNGSKQEERSGQRDDGQSRAHRIRQLQFSDMPSSSPQPHRHPSDQSDIFSTPSAVFPWERDDSRPSSRRRPQPSPQMPSPDARTQVRLERGVGGAEKTDRDASSLEMLSRLSALEKELSDKTGMLKSIQREVVQTKKELAAKEINLQKICDELNTTHTRMSQDRQRASETEHRLKQLQEELKCQRQNAESSRLQHQQRTKELEKQHQRDVTELQKERQCLEKQHQQEVNKLNQELQQAQKSHNALQAQADKLSLQKQTLDKELDTLKEKLKWTEEQLKESQKKEAQTQAKLTEALREAEGVAVSLEQSRKRERALEEEGRRLKEEQDDTLRLLKELQEQKSLPQPVQFCPVGQSFPSQSPSVQPPRPPAHSKRSAAPQAEQKRDERRGEVTAIYPSDREPGEGIDTEHITVIRAGEGRKGDEERNGSRDEAIKWDVSDTSVTSFGEGAADVGLSPLAQSSTMSPENTNVVMSKQTVQSEDLKRENAQLRAELSDTREELQRRLEDLEAQRRAETEARTRLKQLSRKRTSQAAEREEKDKEWKEKLENEKAETEKLKRNIAVLEADIKRSREKQDKAERMKEEEEKTQAQEDRESELMELNIQLKNQLAMVKAQLALEREERKLEEEERNQKMNTDSDENSELSMKLAEIMADVEVLKHTRGEAAEEETPSADSNHSQMGFLDDELNSNVVPDNKPASPEEDAVVCESTNQLNTLMTTEADLEKSQRKNTEQNKTGKFFSSGFQRDELVTFDLVKEVEHLRRKYSKESERANQYQVKFDALQIQVTRQTKELTLAFEKQTQHIAGLLVELQEKDSALFSLGEELMRCKLELDSLKNEGKEKMAEKRSDKSEVTELLPEQDKECVVVFRSADRPAGVSMQPKIETETPTCDVTEDEREVVTSEQQEPVSVDLNTSQSYQQSVCEVPGGTADVFTELITLREENLLLKQKLEDLSVLDERNSMLLQTEIEKQEDSMEQRQNTTPVSCLADQETESVLCNGGTEGQGLVQEHVKKSEDEDLEREERTTLSSENDSQETSDVRVSHLQQQVEALQRKVKSLSEETQTQSQELARWRLASQPAPAFNDLHHNLDDQILDQISEVSQSQFNPQPPDELTQSQIQTLPVQTQVPMWGSHTGQDIITVIREDELSLCSSSNKLRGRMLFSRLQNSSVPDPKRTSSSKKTNTSRLDQESEKENQEIYVERSVVCPEQSKVKRDPELIHISSQRTAHPSFAKDSHKVGPASVSNPTKVVEFSAGTPEAKQDFPRGNSEINTTSHVTEKTEMKSVCSQTEERPASSDTLKVCVSTQTEEELEDEEGWVESPPISPISVSEAAESGDKMLLPGPFPIPADPARLAERIRRNRTQLSAAFDDTEYEPYGLPEVVMKGFADIPSGPSCPYIVRRGLLGTTVVPKSQKEQQEDEETD
ncbi:centromere protein F isoform X2 [Nothobranchius furzeri]|uniref:Transcript variant X3 n=1 Tax=Nothobranchius furzeri TaxID=105023 RepID=A0A9D2YYE5_NOTFU|nr:transcript variant X3 [Nothobranchius furzeri]